MSKPPRNTSRLARDRARELRRTASYSEKRLWEALRADRLGFSFRRQYPIGRYVLDFYCFEARLCVEVDGEQHLHSEERDLLRDEFMARLGVKTLRLPSLDLWDELGVLQSRWHKVIQKECEERAGRTAHEKRSPHPQPPPP